MNATTSNKKQNHFNINSSINSLITEILDIEMIEREMYIKLNESSGVIHDMCYHIAKSGGKRIRPLLVLYSGLIFSKTSEQFKESNSLVNAAVAAELIHMASLVHDDIIDNSELRRNKPSINSVWGNNYAVLCGDYLYAKAFGLLSKNGMTKCLEFMVEAIGNMCDGEILQAGNKFNTNITMMTYYEQITKKTADFISCCCKAGAYLGGANVEQTSNMEKFGINIGLAFQIIDDILDFRGNMQVMGKPKGEDLRQGIITLPIILLLENEKCRSVVLKALEKDKIDEFGIDYINQLLLEFGAIEEAYKIARSHLDKAKQALEALPESRYTKILYALTNKLETRET